MKNNFKLFFIISLIALSKNVLAQDGYTKISDGTELLNRLKSLSNKTTSIKADFKEVRYLSFINEPQISKGEFYFQSDDKMRWEQNSPQEFIFLMNGKSLKVKDDGVEKDLGAGSVVASRINKFTLSLIKGDYQNNKNFETTCFKSDMFHMVKLTPKTKSIAKIYDSIQLHFNLKDDRLTEIHFFESGGDKKVLTFDNQVYNAPLEKQLFNTF